MGTVNLDQMTLEELVDEIRAGSKFVIYKYCVSVLVLTFQQPSGVHLVRSHQSAVGQGMGYTLLSFFAGWWGFPWGPIYTVGALYTNLSGGKDITQQILASVKHQLSQNAVSDHGLEMQPEAVTELPRIDTRR